MQLKFTNLNRTAPSATVSQAVNWPKIAKAEMFSFHSKYFVYRELKRAPQKLSFCFKWPDTGTKPPHYFRSIRSRTDVSYTFLFLCVPVKDLLSKIV